MTTWVYLLPTLAFGLAVVALGETRRAIRRVEWLERALGEARREAASHRQQVATLESCLGEQRRALAELRTGLTSMALLVESSRLLDDLGGARPPVKIHRPETIA